MIGILGYKGKLGSSFYDIKGVEPIDVDITNKKKATKDVFEDWSDAKGLAEDRDHKRR